MPSFKKFTKIVATISDRNCDPDFLRQLFEAGVNTVRLNTAHQTFEDALKVVQNVRAISSEIALMVDTKGPEVRTQEIEDPISVEEGKTVVIVRQVKGPGEFSVNHAAFIDEVHLGHQILIDDGDIALEVIEKNKDSLVCRVLNSGLIKNRKSVNTPQASLSLQSVTKKDEEFIELAARHHVDFIAHSFVRNKEDVLAVQKILDRFHCTTKIIAKIENQEGVDNIEDILIAAYGVMVARGDLGIEIPAEKVPVAQKRIINACLRQGAPVITATQMLHTMIENPRPTRAEVSDVANAIFEDTDAIMLSGETAYGKYPLEAVRMMTRIAQEIEHNTPAVKDRPIFEDKKKTRSYLAKAAVKAAESLPIKAVIVDTISGRTARVLSTYRARVPIFVHTHNAEVLRSLSLSFGVYGSLMPHPVKTKSEFVISALEELQETQGLKDDDLIVIMVGTPGRDLDGGTEVLEINTVANALKSHKEEDLYCQNCSPRH